jgi:hypothetical protein
VRRCIHHSNTRTPTDHTLTHSHIHRPHTHAPALLRVCPCRKGRGAVGKWGVAEWAESGAGGLGGQRVSCSCVYVCVCMCSSYVFEINRESACVYVCISVDYGLVWLRAKLYKLQYSTYHSTHYTTAYTIPHARTKCSV